MKLTELRRDRRKSEEGVWWDFITGERLGSPAKDHLCLLIAEAQNPRYRDAMARLRIEKRAEIRAAGDDAAKVITQLLDEATASAVLLGWANLEDANGNPIEYSPAKALELLRDPEYWIFAQFVRDVSGIAAAYRHDQEKEDQGNS